MRRSITIGLLVVGLLAIAGLVKAQGDWGWGSRWGQGAEMGPWLLAMLDSDRFKSELGLTDRQASRLREIIVDGQKASVKTRAEMRVQSLELRELLRADNPDREAVMKKAQAVSDLRGQMMKQHLDSLLAAKSVLTPEQQRRLRSLRANRALHRGGMEHPLPGFGRGPEQPTPPSLPEPPAQ